MRWTWLSSFGFLINKIQFILLFSFPPSGCVSSGAKYDAVRRRQVCSHPTQGRCVSWLLAQGLWPRLASSSPVLNCVLGCPASLAPPAYIPFGLQGPAPNPRLCGVFSIASVLKDVLEQLQYVSPQLWTLAITFLHATHFPYHLWDFVLISLPGSLPTNWLVTSIFHAFFFLLWKYFILCKLMLHKYLLISRQMKGWVKLGIAFCETHEWPCNHISEN